MVFWLSWRFFRSPYHIQLVKQAFYNAFASLALVFALVVLILGLSQGFKEKTIAAILKFQPHILLYPKAAAPVPAKLLDSLPGIRFWENYFVEKGVLQSKDQNIGILLQYLGPQKYPQIAPNLLQTGRPGGLLIGENIAAQYGLKVNDPLTLWLPFQNKHYETYISGIARLNLYAYDTYFVFTQQKLLPGNSIEINLNDLNNLNRLLALLQKNIGRDYYIKDWRDQNSDIFILVNVIESILLIVFLFTLFLAGFSVKQYLELLIFEKNKTITILKSLGLPWWKQMLIFLLVGSYLIVPAIVLGMLGGGLLANKLAAVLTSLHHGFPALVVDPAGFLKYVGVVLEIKSLTCLAVLGWGLTLLFCLPAVSRVLRSNAASLLR